MMQLFGYPNGIKGWSSSISVEIVIIDDVPYYKLTNPAAFGKGMGIVSQSHISDVAYFHNQLNKKVFCDIHSGWAAATPRMLATWR